MASQTYAVTGSPFLIEATQAGNGVTQLQITAKASFTFTAAGILAIVNEIYTYLNTSSKLATVMRQASRGLAAVAVDVSTASYPVLTTDVASEVANLTAILQTAANVTA
jgi:hypothetical protein